RGFELSFLIRDQRVVSLKLVEARLAAEAGSVESVEKPARVLKFILDEKIGRDLNATLAQTIGAHTARAELRGQTFHRRLIGFTTDEIRVLLRDEETEVVERIGTVRSHARIDRDCAGHESSFTGVGLKSQGVIAERRIRRDLQFNADDREWRRNLFARETRRIHSEVRRVDANTGAGNLIDSFTAQINLYAL